MEGRPGVNPGYTWVVAEAYVIAVFSAPCFKRYASTSWGGQDFVEIGSLHPQLKLGRNLTTPGHLRKSLVPPAGRVVQASVTRYGVSPALGTVIRRGDLRTD